MSGNSFKLDHPRENHSKSVWIQTRLWMKVLNHKKSRYNRKSTEVIRNGHMRLSFKHFSNVLNKTNLTINTCVNSRVLKMQSICNKYIQGNKLACLNTIPTNGPTIQTFTMLSDHLDRKCEKTSRSTTSYNTANSIRNVLNWNCWNYCSAANVAMDVKTTRSTNCIIVCN